MSVRAIHGTPGPWTAEDRGPRDGFRIHSDGRTVAYVQPDHVDEDGHETVSAEQRANAALIAAAPGLRVACEEAEAFLDLRATLGGDRSDTERAVLRKLRAALSGAEQGKPRKGGAR